MTSQWHAKVTSKTTFEFSFKKEKKILVTLYGFVDHFGNDVLRWLCHLFIAEKDIPPVIGNSTMSIDGFVLYRVLEKVLKKLAN